MPQGYPSLRWVTAPRPKMNLFIRRTPAITANRAHTKKGTVTIFPPIGLLSFIYLLPCQIIYSSLPFCASVSRKEEPCQDRTGGDHPFINGMLQAFREGRVRPVAEFGHPELRKWQSGKHNILCAAAFFLPVNMVLIL